jgi:hypothetical protein
MDGFNYIVTEMLASEHIRERRSEPRACIEQPEKTEGSRRRNTLGARLVRLGLRLDPAAGEAFRAPLSHNGARAR